MIDRDDDSLASAAVAMARQRGLDGDLALQLLALEQPPESVDLQPPATPDELGQRFERSLGPRRPDGERKRSGAFYTPTRLAQAATDHALRTIAGDGLPRVIDPAAGSGAFLLAAMRGLRRRHGEDATGAILERSLRGIELDPRAARLCRLCLWLECADPQLDAALFEGIVQVGDALELDLGLERNESFDLVLGNPPWEILKPDSRAFFGRFDPDYRKLRKQQALSRQRELFEADPEIEAGWRQELARHREFQEFCDRRFRLQGRSGDPNLYKLFVERGLELCRDGGLLQMLVPAGLHADLGARELRRALLEEHDWIAIHGFENRDRLFPDVDGRFKFDLISVRRGGRSAGIAARFMQRDPDCLRHQGGLRLSMRQVRQLSPRSLALPELRCDRELALLEGVRERGVLFGDDSPTGWRLGFRRELDLTIDSDRFVGRELVEGRGLRPDRHGRWLAFDRAGHDLGDPDDPDLLLLRDGRQVPIEALREVWLPLHEGRMVEAFDDAAKGWVEGHGRRAIWRPQPEPARLAPQYLVRAELLDQVDPQPDRPKVGFLAIGSATNARSMLATTLLQSVCGNSVPVLRSDRGEHAELALCAVLNSLCYDRALRIRLTGNNLNRFALDETCLPDPASLLAVPSLPVAVASLCWTEPRFAAGWLGLRERLSESAGWRPCQATAPAERLRLRTALEALVAAAYGLGADDLAWITAECWRPSDELKDRGAARRFDPKGMWRIDRDLSPQRRLPVLAVAALRHFERGVGALPWPRRAENFLREWRLPESVDLRALGFEDAPAGDLPLEPTPREAPVNDDLEIDWRRCVVESRRARSRADG